MPRNARKGRKPNQEEPLLQYNKLPVSYQLVVYKFWCHLEYGETTLWNPDETPNTINNWRSSTYIKNTIKKGSWPNIARVSASVGNSSKAFAELFCLNNRPRSSLAYVTARKGVVSERRKTQKSC